MRNTRKISRTAIAATLKAISPIFAVALAGAVRVEGGEEPPEEEPESKENEGGLEEPDKPKRRKKGDADWWKHGEPPPF
jgi:hypothetical protein